MSDNTVQGTLQQDAEQALRALASMEAGVRGMIERLLQSEQALRGGGAAMETYGASVAQASAAMQVLPVQLAAMAAGLIAGQEPIALLSEQAVKLAEAFGGIAPTAAAVGEAVATMVNPFTAAAATTVVLTVATSKGSRKRMPMRAQSPCRGTPRVLRFRKCRMPPVPSRKPWAPGTRPRE